MTGPSRRRSSQGSNARGQAPRDYPHRLGMVGCLSEGGCSRRTSTQHAVAATGRAADDEGVLHRALREGDASHVQACGMRTGAVGVGVGWDAASGGLLLSCADGLAAVTCRTRAFVLAPVASCPTTSAATNQRGGAGQGLPLHSTPGRPKEQYARRRRAHRHCSLLAARCVLLSVAVAVTVAVASPARRRPVAADRGDADADAWETRAATTV